MSGLVSGPKTPKPPRLEQPPKPPTEQDVAQASSRNAVLAALRKERRRGAAADILTGPDGLSNLGGVKRRGVLGG